MDEFLHRAQQVDVFCLAGARKIGVVAGQCTYAVFFTSGKDNGIIWQQVVFFHKMDSERKDFRAVGQPLQQLQKRKRVFYQKYRLNLPGLFD